MNSYTISSVSACIIGLVLATFVFIKKREGPENRTFALMTAVISIWCLVPFGTKLVNNAFFSLWYARALHLAAVFVPTCFLMFANAIIGKEKNLLKRPVRISAAISASFLLPIFSPLFISGVRLDTPNGSIVAGPLYHVFMVFFAAMALYGFNRLFGLFRAVSGYKRNRLRYVLIATILAVAGGILYFYSNLFGKEPLPHDILIIVYFFAIAYAILRYRLLDIAVAVTRTTIFAAVYGLVLGLPFLLTTVGKAGLTGLLGAHWWIAPLVLMALLASAGPFAYINLLRRAEAILLREQRSYQKTLKQAAIGIARIRNSKRLMQFLAHIVTKTVRISHSAIYLYDEAAGAFFLKAGRFIKKDQPGLIHTKSALIRCLKQYKEPVIYEDIKREAEEDTDPGATELEEQMRSLGAAVVLGSFEDDRLLDILLLGDKRSGRPYTAEDLNNFSVLATEAGVAIENARRYETIEEQVRQRTAELVEVQRQLVQAEKLATVGTLAGGVAHEINNPLTAVLTNVQMLLVDAGSLTPDSRESLELIEEATKRCRTIVQKLMVYAKKPQEHAHTSLVDLVRSARNVTSFLAYQFEQENIKICIEQEGDSYCVLGDANEIEQVFTNIILNAKDAIKKIKKDGRVSLFFSEDDSFINIAVKDDGAGIPRDVMPKIFDPFFTTKDIGKGLGLGLSICQAIVDKHKGMITVDSKQGEGSVFTVRLPKPREGSRYGKKNSGSR